MPEPSLVATCKGCGAPNPVVPGQVPPCAGSVAARGDRVRGWEILESVCGPCWAQRAGIWTCAACGGEGFEGANFCSACHSVRPDPRHFADEGAHARDEEEQAREFAAMVVEADREYPGWRTAGLRRRSGRD